MLGLRAGILNLTDCMFTLYVLKMGLAVELNPLMAMVLKFGPLTFLIVKFLISLMVLWLSTINNKIADVGIWIIGILYLAINIYEISFLFVHSVAG